MHLSRIRFLGRRLKISAWVAVAIATGGGAHAAVPPAAASPGTEFTRAEFSAKLDTWLKKAKNPGGAQEEPDTFALARTEDADGLLEAMARFPLTPSSTQKLRAEVLEHPRSEGALDRLMKAPASDPADLYRAIRILVWSADAHQRGATFKAPAMAQISRIMKHEAQGPANAATAVFYAGSLELLGEKGWTPADKRAEITRLSQEINRFQTGFRKRVEAKNPDYLALALDEMKTCTPFVKRAAAITASAMP